MSWRDRAVPVANNNNNGTSWRDRAKKVEDWVGDLTTTKQVMHPDISLKDRLIAKNFSQSQEKQLEFLKAQYPNLQFDVSTNGQIRAKSPGSKEWNVLDPDTGIISTDSLRDLGDIGFDLFSGVTEGGASALGAAGGAAISAPLGGVGAIPGAMAASGATAAGNEAIRQKLGQWLGIPQQVDMTDVAVTGGVGAISPLLFGAGKATGLANVAGKAAKKGLSKINPLYKIGSAVSGTSEDALRTYANPEFRQVVDELEQKGITEYTGKALDKINDYASETKDKAVKDYVTDINNANRLADTGAAKKSFADSTQELAEQDFISQADESKIDAINKAYNRYFSNRGGTQIPNQVTPDSAFKLQKDLKKLADFDGDLTPENIHMKATARDAYMNMRKAIDEASEGLTIDSRDRLKDVYRFEDEILPKFQGKNRLESIQKTYNELSGLNRNNRRAFAEELGRMSKDSPLDLTNEAKILSTYKELGSPSMLPVSSGGKTSTTRSVPLAGLGGYVGGSLGYNVRPTGDPTLDRAIGGATGAGLATLLGSPAAMKAYIRAMQKAGRAKDLITPRDTGLWRGVKTGLSTEIFTEPE